MLKAHGLVLAVAVLPAPWNLLAKQVGDRAVVVWRHRTTATIVLTSLAIALLVAERSALSAIGLGDPLS